MLYKIHLNAVLQNMKCYQLLYIQVVKFMCILELFLSGPYCELYEIYSEDGPSTYVYCMVCYCVIAAPYITSVIMSLHTLHS